MSMNTPIGNITQTTPIKDFKELDEMQNEQYLLGIDDNTVGNGSKISLENLINSSISADNDNLITKGTDDRLLVNTPVEIGDLSNLTTTNKSTLVAAINEVDSDLATEVTNRTNAVSGEATIRANADNNLQSQIDTITAASDVTDIVGTYAELQAYDTTGLPNNSIIKVLQDENHQNARTYYRWVITGGVGAWVLIGEESPYYTISQADSKFATQETVGNLNNLVTSDKSSIVNAMNELASVLDPTQTADYIKNSKAIYSGEVSGNALILPQIKEMAHSTFDLSKFTVVGSPNITDDGIISGFSDSSYIVCPQINSQSTDLKMVVPVSMVETNKTRYILGTSSASTGVTIAVNGKKGNIYLFFTDNTNSSSINFTLPDAMFNNQIIYLVLEWTGSRYNLYYSLTQDGNKNLIAYVDSTKVLKPFIPNIGSGTYTWGREDRYWEGRYDLKQFSIKSDGVEVFSGNKTGIDTIKPDDYTVVGTPTISADGIASGFSGALTYVDTGYDVSLYSNYEIITKIKTDNLTTNYQMFLSTSIIRGLDIGFNTNKLWFGIATSPSSNFNYQISTETFLSNKDYYIKLAYKNGTYKVSYSTNGINYTDTSISIVDESYDGGNILLGTFYNTSSVDQHFKGSIDLNAFKIYVDGNLVYQPCLKIPYTESKTGSKIVDSIYRDRVIDMYNQRGCAPYYTFSDTDFTLPQGEIYGYLEKRARDIAHPVAVPFFRLTDEINEDEVRLEGAEVDKGLYLAIEQNLPQYCTEGSTSDKICLPDFRDRVPWGGNTQGYIEAGLPNISGYIAGVRCDNTGGADSAIYSSSPNSYTGHTGGDGYSGLSFNASRSSSIYGNSTTVQPPAFKVRWLARYK